MILVSSRTSFGFFWTGAGEADLGRFWLGFDWGAGMDRSDRLPLLSFDQLVRRPLPFFCRPTHTQGPPTDRRPRPPHLLSYQNHRRYVLSLDTDQLRGEERSV